jgi:hypothetical protein
MGVDSSKSIQNVLQVIFAFGKLFVNSNENLGNNRNRMYQRHQCNSDFHKKSVLLRLIFGHLYQCGTPGASFLGLTEERPRCCHALHIYIKKL